MAKRCSLSKSELPTAPSLKDHAKAPPSELKAPKHVHQPFC